MKKFLPQLCLCALLASVPSLAACEEAAGEQGTTSLELMEEVNSANILHPDDQSRIWYTISLPAFMGTALDSEARALGSAAVYMDYFSDGNVEDLDSDLNMNGLYVKNLIRVNENGHTWSLLDLNQAVADEDVLRRFCAGASAKGMAVMMDFNVTAIAKDSEEFQKDLEIIKKAAADGVSLSDIEGGLRDKYWIDHTKHSDQWHAIDGTDWYYYGADGSEDPMLKPASEQAKAAVKEAIDWYTGLGIGAFYLQDISSAVTDPAALKDYLSWFDATARERNENVIVISDGSTENDALRGTSAYLADQGIQGTDGAIVQAVTGSMSPQDLGKALETRALNSDSHTVNRLSFDQGLSSLSDTASAAQLKMALALNLLLPGQTFVFAGDELGLSGTPESPVFSSLATPDIEGKGNGAEAINLEENNSAAQSQDGNSVLNFVRQAILLRDSYTAISSGSLTYRDDLSSDKVLVLEEINQSSHVLLAFNLSDTPASVDCSDVLILDLPAELGGMLVSGDEAVSLEDNSLYLPGCSVALLK